MGANSDFSAFRGQLDAPTRPQNPFLCELGRLRGIFAASIGGEAIRGGREDEVW
jgi:hypothetical protein